MTGIIGAMESEVNAIYAQMENKEIVEYNGIKFYKGSLYGKDVVVIQCGIGKVNAALCTQLLILKFGVDKVVIDRENHASIYDGCPARRHPHRLHRGEKKDGHGGRRLWRQDLAQRLMHGAR